MQYSDDSGVLESFSYMTKEEEFVVNPLCEWFHRQKAAWGEPFKPNHGKSATGWDVEIKRKNRDLLIEAKYIDNQSITTAIADLVLAPLTDRPQRNLKIKYRSSCHCVCWAIGINPNDKRHLYQALLDYLSRNPTFWKHYSDDLRLKYIFFVRGNMVAKALFSKLLEITTQYDRESKGKKLNEKRVVADVLMKKILKFS